jgi:hypothetical protein
MPLPANIPRCAHLHMSGQQCGSPAERERRFCYFHNYVRSLSDAGYEKTPAPVVEDAFGVQAGIVRVLQMLEKMPPTPKTCALMLYALQTASANLKKLNEQARAIAEENEPEGESLLDIMRRELALEPPPEGCVE